MLQTAATNEDTDWDKLILYLPFNNWEETQACIGSSPFKFPYGWAVPLDVSKEYWESSSKNSESIVS